MAGSSDPHKYDDIIHLSRPVSGRHARMSLIDRGAQFSPFAALTGHNEVLQEAARKTDAEPELSAETDAALDEQLHEIAEHIDEMPEVTFTLFERDIYKGGGNFVQVTGRVRRIDTARQRIYLADGRNFRIDKIYEIAYE